MEAEVNEFIHAQPEDQRQLVPISQSYFAEKSALLESNLSEVCWAKGKERISAGHIGNDVRYALLSAINQMKEDLCQTAEAANEDTSDLDPSFQDALMALDVWVNLVDRFKACRHYVFLALCSTSA